jgi:hypothetical protein
MLRSKSGNIDLTIYPSKLYEIEETQDEVALTQKTILMVLLLIRNSLTKPLLASVKKHFTKLLII